VCRGQRGVQQPEHTAYCPPPHLIFLTACCTCLQMSGLRGALISNKVKLPTEVGPAQWEALQHRPLFKI
jgi:hypothetical protein